MRRAGRAALALLAAARCSRAVVLDTFAAAGGQWHELALTVEEGKALTLAVSFKVSANVAHTAGQDSVTVALPSEYYWLLWPLRGWAPGSGGDAVGPSANASVTMLTTYTDSGGHHHCAGTVAVDASAVSLTQSELNCGSIAGNNFAAAGAFLVELQLARGAQLSHRFPCRDPGAWTVTLTEPGGALTTGTNNFAEDDGVPGCHPPGAISVEPTILTGGLGDRWTAVDPSSSYERGREQLLLRFGCPGGLPRDARLELTYLDEEAWVAVKNASIAGAWAGMSRHLASPPMLSHSAQGAEYEGVGGMPDSYTVTLDWRNEPMPSPIAVVPDLERPRAVQVLFTFATRTAGVDLHRLVPYWTVSRTAAGVPVDNVRWGRQGYGDTTVPRWAYAQLRPSAEQWEGSHLAS